MNDSLLSVLETIRPSLPSSLIDQGGYARVAAVAGQLPEEMTTFWGFECRLADPEAKADILLETRRESRGQEALAGRLPSCLDNLCQQWPTWQNLREFARRWADPNGPFAKSIRNLWFEFDTAGAASPEQAAESIGLPSVFLGPVPAGDGVSGLVQGALAELGHPELGNGFLDSFVRAFPPGAHLFQVGLMLSRVNPGLRVCVNKVSSAVIPDWLVSVGWKGDPHALAGILGNLAPILQTMAVDLNLADDGPSEKIGLECYMDWMEEDPGPWMPLFRFLDESQLCLAQKRQGLFEFPGISRTLADERTRDPRVLYLNLLRRLHHIKLSITGGRVIEAKAYLALTRPVLYLDQSLVGSRDGWIVE